MRVQMNVKIGGYRNEAEWPEVGGVIEVPDHEGRDLIAVGYAKEAPRADQDEQPASNSSEEAGDAEAGDTVEQGDPEPVADEDDPDAGDETLTDFFAVEEGERPDDGEPGVQLPAVGGGDVLPPAVEKPATGRRKK